MDCPFCKVVDYATIPTCQKQENAICPHVRRCTEHRIWKPLDYMAHCPIRFRKDGNVVMERHGYLYISVKDEIVKVKNPYDYIPDNVELRKYKGNYKVVVKENKGNEKD